MKIFLTILIFLFSLQVSYGQKTIKGKVVDNIYFPVSDVSIEIQGGGSATTDKNGEFSISVKKTPYNLTLIDKENYTAVRYEDLTTLNPELKLFTKISQRNSNNEIVNIELPKKIPPGNEAFLQFLSKDVFISQKRKIPGGKSTSTLNIEWPVGKESIQGYIFYIETSGDQFTNYFYYPVTITKQNSGFYQRIILPSFYTDYKPGTSTITINPIMYDLVTPRYSIYAEFSELGINSFIEFPVKKESDGRIIANVPSTLPFDYRLKLQTDLGWKNGKGYTKFSYLRSATMTLNPSREDVPVILSPLDVNIKYDTSTSFSYSKNFGYGIFVVSFYNNPSPFPAPNAANGTFHIVTTKQIVKHPLENSYGILNGNNYSWYVSNYSEFKDSDDFVKTGRSKIDFGESKIARSERKNLEFIFN